MDVSVWVASLSVNYGLVDGVDLGVTVPLVRTAVSGQSTAQLLLVGGDTLQRFAGTGTNPVLTSSSAVDGSATGLGDVEGRLKINLAQSDRFGAAFVGFARFPTGDERNLLGAGRFSGRALGVVSARFGNFSPHANFASPSGTNTPTWWRQMPSATPCCRYGPRCVRPPGRQVVRQVDVSASEFLAPARTGGGD
jgi:hypothetical protein